MRSRQHQPGVDRQQDIARHGSSLALIMVPSTRHGLFLHLLFIYLGVSNATPAPQVYHYGWIQGWKTELPTNSSQGAITTLQWVHHWRYVDNKTDFPPITLPDSLDQIHLPSSVDHVNTETTSTTKSPLLAAITSPPEVVLMPSHQELQHNTFPPASPCPHVFRYDRFEGEWVGMIEVFPPTSSKDVKLDVELMLPVWLPSKNIGKLELAEDKQLVFGRLYKGREESIRYRVRFPMQFPLPVITSVQLNGRKICGGGAPASRSGDMSTIHLNHKIHTYAINA